MPLVCTGGMPICHQIIQAALKHLKNNPEMCVGFLALQPVAKHPAPAGYPVPEPVSDSPRSESNDTRCSALPSRLQVRNIQR
jgi:hypothetical protein